MKNQENKNKVILAIAQAYEVGNTSMTDRIESIVIPDSVKLPKELQGILDSWGNNPIDEPEFFKLTSTASLEDLKVAAVKELDIDNFSALDIATLANRTYKKITLKIDEDGKYKSTTNIDVAKLPKTSQLRALKKLSLDGVEGKDLSKEIFKIAGVKKADLTEWEQELILGMTMDFARAVDSDTIGGQADRTPFARYIKN